jgi:hypothetical protein
LFFKQILLGLQRVKSIRISVRHSPRTIRRDILLTLYDTVDIQTGFMFEMKHWFQARITKEEELRETEVLTAVKMLAVVFWFVTPYGLVGGYRRFGEAYRFHLHG